MSKTTPTEQSIFLIARQIQSQPEQQAYLDQICAEDRQLRADVEALLSADERCDDVLAMADQLATTTAPEAIEASGEVVGPYKLLEKIGEGGMGVVFMAEQKEPVRRRVALKIIKPGMDTKLVVARFEAERQALAMMDHQNIARVLDAGETSSGRPYFVMELVKGVPITEFCDSNQLSLAERLELFQQVCHAIAHSHQKGIIHRDIKPNNVLVCNYDGKPVPKVIDFGVAKATHQQLTEKTLFTQHGQVVGTLEYMSPEQAELSQLDIDTRSDIYALGVLLYELLTGSTPITRDQIRSTGFIETLRLIREEEAERPSTRMGRTASAPGNRSGENALDLRKRAATLRSELDWIVLKALEKDRKRRYQTVNTLNADISRYLADEPVEACPPSISYRLRKLVRRHRSTLSKLAVALTIVALTIGFLAWNRAATEQVRMEYEQTLAIDKAFQGQLGAALVHAGKADTHGAGPVWTHKLAGIVELYKHHGSSESAIREFENALKLDPHNVSVKSLLAIAYVWDGRWEDHERMLADVSEQVPSPEDLEVHFFLGQALMWSDPERSVELLRHVHQSEQWAHLPVVNMMLAEALSKWAWENNEQQDAQEAIRLANKARDAMPDNASARAMSNYCYTVAADIRRANGEPYADLLDASADNVRWIEQQPDYLIGFPNRAWYYDLRGTREDTKKAIELWRGAVVQQGAGGWYASCYAAEMYRHDESRSALQEIIADPADPDLQLARLLLLMDADPEQNRAEALSICQSSRNVQESRHCADVQLMMWLRMGNLEEARALARRLMAKGDQPDAYKVIVGTTTPDMLFDDRLLSRSAELHARLLVAMHQMAQGRTAEAQSTLEPAVQLGGRMLGAQPGHWARAFFERPFTTE